MDIDKVKENLKNTVFQEYAKSVGKLIRRDYNTIIKIIDDGDLYDILEDNYYMYFVLRKDVQMVHFRMSIILMADMLIKKKL